MVSEQEQKSLCLLKSVCELSDESHCDVYIDVCGRLPMSDDVSILREMLLCFRDVDCGEIQYELVAACERFPRGVLVQGLLDVGLRVYRMSPQWITLVLSGVVGGDDFERGFRSRLMSEDEREEWRKCLAEFGQRTGLASLVRNLMA